MGKAERYTYGVSWLPVPGRPEVCRRPGCREPAVTETLQLCEEHLAAYRVEVAHVLAEQDARRQAKGQGA